MFFEMLLFLRAAVAMFFKIPLGERLEEDVSLPGYLCVCVFALVLAVRGPVSGYVLLF